MKWLLLKFPTLTTFAVAGVVLAAESALVAQAAPVSPASSGASMLTILEKLTQLGAIGIILAFILYQQTIREKRQAEEIKDRESKMRKESDELREFITTKLMEVVEKSSQNIHSCQGWRNEAREQLSELTERAKK